MFVSSFAFLRASFKEKKVLYVNLCCFLNCNTINGMGQNEQRVGKMAIGKFLLLKGSCLFLLNCLGFGNNVWYGFFSFLCVMLAQSLHIRW